MLCLGLLFFWAVIAAVVADVLWFAGRVSSLEGFGSLHKFKVFDRSHFDNDIVSVDYHIL